MKYYVYIISNKHHTVFYTGVTNDLKRRTFQHKTGFYRAAFSRIYNCNQLLYFEEWGSREDALSREKELKRFRRDWKLQMIRKMNPGLKDLSGEWIRDDEIS